ncbi:hypothetical protein HGB07_06315 [Candidatus Roizmanbacteria bacterium]|nr:hypothetical protein [Candidatus Roizmanbacteria bacterium]
MTGAEILALIGAFAGGSVGTGFLANALYDGFRNAHALLPITDARKKAISKQWTGAFEQGGQSYSISLNLKVNRRRIVGDVRYRDSFQCVNLVVTGGFYRDDHLHLSYKNKDTSVFQHGLIVLHVPNNPKTLTGKFVGIGRDSNQIVGGDITINA